ncbi:Asp-tRNA(Asn)/Glu-tRNA(Gln) amidotransferase subunit GatC [Candidatus Gottesmanbacteria bacterium]|nr:Asp-tRNA(Asn)/Glu-tRNA(Gln) amidotransferase subunit GatC [Candidatus Gottesmanbacteria bacterium]
MKKTQNKLTLDTVKHVADLAKLQLNKEDINKFQEQLSDILDFVAKLGEVDTKNIPPTSQVTGVENVFREDKVRKSLSQDEALANAKRKHNGYFVVRAIFEE